MRQLTLYIDGQQVDLGEESLVLMNYTTEELTKPNVVKNTYSQRVTLEGTERNNAVFGSIWRAESIQSGAADPRKRRPFAIYDNTNRIIVSGYVKLSNVTQTGHRVQYEVELFGGLGSFLYNLTYNDEGKKLSLADLHYIKAQPSADELTFRITKEAITEAWARLSATPPVRPGNKWDVINFAPCYNGKPSDKFSADRGIFNVKESGQPTNVGGFGTQSDNLTIAILPQKVDEYAAKDFRSYLQRPVFSLSAVLSAVSDPDNNGGYTVNWPCLEQLTDYAPYSWVTLPMLSKDSIQTESDSKVDRFDLPPVTSKELFSINVGQSYPIGSEVDIKMTTLLRFAPTNTTPYSYWGFRDGRRPHNNCALAFIEVVGYDARQQPIKAAPIMGVGDLAGFSSLEDYAKAASLKPVYATEYEGRPRVSRIDLNSLKPGQYDCLLETEFGDARDITYLRVFFHGTVHARGAAQAPRIVSGVGITVYQPGESAYTKIKTIAPDVTVKTTWSNVTSARSGALITKKTLLSSTATPADYLLSFIKMFGLHIVCSNESKEVTVYTRQQFYNDPEVVDISELVDRSQPIETKPTVYDKKWLTMEVKGDESEYIRSYNSTFGKAPGIFRLDTCIDFDRSDLNLMDKVVFKNAVSVQENSQFYNIIRAGVVFYPSPFLLGGTYKLFSATESKEFPIIWQSQGVTTRYYNEKAKGFDLATTAKAQFHNDEGKAIKGDNVLLLLNRFFPTAFYEYFKISDDEPRQIALNDGVPCWDMREGRGVEAANFSRYLFNERTQDKTVFVTRSLDFGNSEEVRCPYWLYDPTNVQTPVSFYWRKYLADRTAESARVVKCRVLLRGEVGIETLRKFYYFDNSLWVLNKINNYSLTTHALTECEFIKVQSIDNYTQIY